MQNSKSIDKRKVKALLFLPLLVIPFLTMAFWALGGGKGEAQTTVNGSGLNLQLPNARLKDDKGENKMSFYDEAERDSAKRKEGAKSDSLHLSPALSGFPDTSSIDNRSAYTYDPYPPAGSYRDPNEQKVYQKLSQLNRQLNSSAAAYHKEREESTRTSGMNTASADSEGVERLDRLMRSMNDKSSAGEDPEMSSINAMMEKILDIQHPERVRERRKENSAVQKGKVYPVSTEPVHSSVSLLDTGRIKKEGSSRFYGLEDEAKVREDNAIPAVVPLNQTLVSGGVIRLRLTQDIYVNGNLIPAGTFVNAIANLNGERLEAQITSIRYNASLYSVKLQLYDMDGLPGIYIPGAMTRDVAKGSVDNAVQVLGITSLDPSLKAQAAGAGLSAAKTLLSKKAKLVKVSLKADYAVLLKAEAEEQ